MKNSLFCLLVGLMFATAAMAQSAKSISILGDSYSTFQGYLQPDTNFVWYWDNPKAENTDVHHVRETWWHQFIKENGYRLCVNNSFSGSTICYSGYKSGKPDFTDYSDRSFVTRHDKLGTPDMFLAEVVSVTVDDAYMNETGKFLINELGLVMYSHGEYFAMGEKLGKFGYSIQKK